MPAHQRQMQSTFSSYIHRSRQVLLHAGTPSSLPVDVLSADYNAWDDVYEPLIHIPVGLAFLFIWCMLFIVTLQHIRQHIGSHGVKQVRFVR